jgi:hypothetical protein
MSKIRNGSWWNCVTVQVDIDKKEEESNERQVVEIKLSNLNRVQQYGAWADDIKCAGARMQQWIGARLSVCVCVWLEKTEIRITNECVAWLWWWWWCWRWSSKEARSASEPSERTGKIRRILLSLFRSGTSEQKCYEGWRSKWNTKLKH